MRFYVNLRCATVKCLQQIRVLVFLCAPCSRRSCRLFGYRTNTTLEFILALLHRNRVQNEYLRLPLTRLQSTPPRQSLQKYTRHSLQVLPCLRSLAENIRIYACFKCRNKSRPVWCMRRNMELFFASLVTYAFRQIIKNLARAMHRQHTQSRVRRIFCMLHARQT